MCKPLFVDAEWDLETIEKTWTAIDKIAKEEFELDYYDPQIEIITSDQMLELYSSNGLPMLYSHWSHGKSFIVNQREYRGGRMGLAYEIVINTKPTIAYLMENNSMTMQALVLAHASCGHGSFFKNNYLFKEWTNPELILHQLRHAKDFIAQCEEQYGEDEVEYFLDACHSLKYHGIDKYKRFPTKNEGRKEKWREYEAQLEDRVQKILPTDKVAKEKALVRSALEAIENSECPLPEENLLYYMEKYSTVLKPWQREIIKITRNLAQYFYPQMQTKMMNEGYATFIHYHIMTRMEEKGLITEGSYLEFLKDHTAVTAQPTVGRSLNLPQINPYALGFAMFQDIKRICEEPTDEDRKWFPEIAGGDWNQVTKEIVENYRDESFVLQFLSPKLIRELKLCSIAFDDDSPYALVDNVHTEEDIFNIRQVLAKSYDISEMIPKIEIVHVDDVELDLHVHHTVIDGKLLHYEEAKQTTQYLHELWGHRVYLEYVDKDGNVVEDVE